MLYHLGKVGPYLETRIFTHKNLVQKKRHYDYFNLKKQLRFCLGVHTLFVCLFLPWRLNSSNVFMHLPQNFFDALIFRISFSLPQIVKSFLHSGYKLNYKNQKNSLWHVHVHSALTDPPHTITVFTISMCSATSRSDGSSSELSKCVYSVTLPTILSQSQCLAHA